jgi:hypothetical protein
MSVFLHERDGLEDENHAERRQFWQNTLNFLGRCLFSLLRQSGGFPDEYYNAKDLGDGNVQKLFGSEKQRKRSWWRPG